MGYKLTIVGKDEGLKMDKVLCKKELDTIKEVLSLIDSLIPNVHTYGSIRAIHIEKVM